MKSPERVFTELIEDEIVFNVGLSRSDRLRRDEFADVLERLFNGNPSSVTYERANQKRRGDVLYIPEHAFEDIAEARKNFIEAAALLGVSMDDAVRILKHTFSPVFAARFEHYREILTYLYRLSHDEGVLERAIRA